MYISDTVETEGFTVNTPPSFVGGAQAWSAIGWVRKGFNENLGPFGVGGVFSFRFASTNNFGVNLLKSDNTVEPRAATRTHTVDEWMLVAATCTGAGSVSCYIFNNANTTGGVFTLSYSGTLGTAQNVQIGRRTFAENGTTLGWFGWKGELGCISLRPGVASAAELQAMYDSRSMVAPMQMAVDGNEFGDADAWAVLHGVVQSPAVDGVTAITGARAGSSLASGNILVYHNETGVASATSPIVARLCSDITSLTYKDHRADFGDFFNVALPVGVSENAAVLNSPIAYRLAAGTPRGVETILCAANSRAVRFNRFAAVSPQTDIPFGFPASWDQAYLMERIAVCAGVVFQNPSTLSTIKRFGFDTGSGNFFGSTASEVEDFSQTGSYSDFSRWTSGNFQAGGVGVGRGLRIASDGVYSAKARAEAASLLTTARDWTMRVRYLRYPGGRNFSWEHRTGSVQGTIGTLAGGAPSGSVTDADTTVHTHTMAVGDSYTEGTRVLDLATASLSPAPQAGWAVCITSGDGATSMAEIESVDGTEITLRHVFGAEPATDSVFKIGPVEYAAVTYTAPASSDAFRGPVVTAGSGTLDTIILGHDAIAQGVQGFVFGQIGKSGAGYGLQISEGILNLHGRLADFIGADAVFLHKAHQSSTAADYKSVADIIANNSDAQPLLLADPDYSFSEGATESIITFANYPILQGGTVVYPGARTTGDSTIGSDLEQIAAFHRHDAAHLSAEGARAVVQSYMALFSSEFEDDAPPVLRLSRGRGSGSVSSRSTIRVINR